MPATELGVALNAFAGVEPLMSPPPEIRGGDLVGMLRPSLEEALTPDIIHFPTDIAHPFPVSESGEDLDAFADLMLSETRLPLTSVREKAYIPNEHGTHGVLGSWETAGPHQGRLTFYKDMKRIPAIAQFGVAFHEGSHAVSPFTTDSAKDYGGEANRQRVQENVLAIASQAEATGIFLNGYHAHIYNLKRHAQTQEELAQWAQLYLEETHAIANELAVTNYKHLQQVEERQFARLKELDQVQGFVPFTSRINPETGRLQESDLDWTIRTLTKFDTPEEMHRYFRGIRARYGGTRTPFHDVPDEPFEFLPFIPGTERIIVIYGQKRRNPWEEILGTPAEKLERERDRRTRAT